MKVRVKGNTREDLEITFFITSAEEKVIFHDRVAISICDGSSEFISHCYRPERKASLVEYEILTKKAISEQEWLEQ